MDPLTQNQPPEEIVRSCLCALAWKSAREAVPVHILRLSHLTSKFGLTEDITTILRTRLMLMRECEDLGNGFWLPTPPRIVPLSECRLLIAPNSTTELKLVFGPSVKIAGLARTIDLTTDCDLPIEPIESWCRVPGDLKEWTITTLKKMEGQMQPVLSDEEPVQIYCDWVKKSYLKNGIMKESWQDIRTILPPNKRIVLCRKQLFGRWRYFLSKIRKSTIESEAIIVDDVPRILHGLDMLANEPTHISYGREFDRIIFRLPRYLPREEYRLVLALCASIKDPSIDYYPYYFMESIFFDDIKFHFEKLGYIWRLK